MEKFKSIDNDGQYNINFDKPLENDSHVNLNAVSSAEQVSNILNDLNKKYPYARLSPTAVEMDQDGNFLIKDKTLTKEELEDYVSLLNNSYKPEETDKYWDK